MDLQNQISERLAKELSDAIDFEVIVDILTSCGWTKLKVKYMPPHQSWHKVKEWADQNCQGDYQEHSGTWLFELEKDANWFSLRWQIC